MAIFNNGYENVAFSMPGGDIAAPGGSRPIDMTHLSRQTMGDRELEREVLGLFLEQMQTVRRQIEIADLNERASLAHALKGSAGGVGALAIAKCAALIEAEPANRRSMKRLAQLIDEACDFIASINR